MLAIAPAIGTPPRVHWNENVGLSVQVPGVQVSVWPETADPLNCGGLVFAGGETVVVSERQRPRAVPFELVAVTRY